MALHDLYELKTKLSGVIVLVMAVRFVEHLFEEGVNPLDLVYYSLATALVAAALIAFGYFSDRSHPQKDDNE